MLQDATGVGPVVLLVQVVLVHELPLEALEAEQLATAVGPVATVLQVVVW